MSFIDKLRTKKNTLKQSSVDTYIRNIKRIRKVVGDLPIPPKDHKWLLSPRLLKWYDEQTLNVQRPMASAAGIALAVYDKKSQEWRSRQRKAMEQYDQNRRKRRLTDKQKAKMPEKGFDSLKKVITQMKKELKHVISKIETMADLLRVQDLLILSLYYDIPLRLDYATLQTEKSDSKNCIFKQKRPSGWFLELHDFKTSKSLGSKKFKMNQSNQRLLNKFVPAKNRLTDHGFLLTNKKGNKMSKQVLSKTLMKITKARLGHNFSVQLLRILYAMRNRDVIETAKEVSDKLLHSAKQSLEYAKKDPKKSKA